MFNLTDCPELMAELKVAIAQAARDVASSASSGNSRDTTLEWLTTKEAIAFLRVSKRTFQKFRERHPGKLVVSMALGSAQPRYQLASLQEIMREQAIGPIESARKVAAGSGTHHVPLDRPARKAF